MRLLTPNLKYFFITNSEADALWGEFIIPLDERKDIDSWFRSLRIRAKASFTACCVALYVTLQARSWCCYSATQLDNRCV